MESPDHRHAPQSPQSLIRGDSPSELTESDIYFLQANEHLDNGQASLAIDGYTHVIEMDPSNSVAYNNRGIAYRQVSDLEKAIADYTKAIQLSPNYREAYTNRGLAFLDSADYEAAIIDCNRAIELDPTFWYAYSNRGLALWALGNRKAAVEDYAHVKELVELHNHLSE
jgi:tetratricopeptide (TPR) repeat protein